MNNKPSRLTHRSVFSGAPGPGDTASAAVYPPREDSFLLIPFARVPPGTTVAEVGAGAGSAALSAAREGARVVATDLNPAALRQLRKRARAQGLELEAVRTDLLRGLGRFDRVLANPPYLPTLPEERDPDPWANLALDGGPDGCRVLARLVEDLASHLAPSGSAYVVVSSLQDPKRRSAILAGWQLVGGCHEVVASRQLEGERLEVLRLYRGTTTDARLRGARRAVRRTRARPRGTDGRRQSPRKNRPASSQATAPGRTTVRGAASARTRSPPGS